MPSIRLSDIGLVSLKPQDRHIDFWDSSLPSFGVRVSPKGTKTFMLKLHNGRQAIGRYPLISLSQARTEAKRLLAEKTLGRLRPSSLTFSRAVELFIEGKKKNRRPNTYEAYEWHLNRLDLKGRLAGITHDDVVRALKRIKSKSTYDHALVALRIFFNWCIDSRHVTENPTRGLSPYGTPKRARVLADDELKKIWKACVDDTSQLPQHYRIIVKLLMLTGQRRGEIAALQSSWVKADMITLPKEVTKNSHEHCFPIGALAAALLPSTSEAIPTLIFPARGKNTPFNGWSKSKATLDKLSGVTNWTLHDLRRTFRSNLARIGVAPHIAERLVNHVNARSDMELVYDRYTYMPEMRATVERFDKWFSTLIS